MLSSCFYFCKQSHVRLFFPTHQFPTMIYYSKIVRFFRPEAALIQQHCNKLIINSLQYHSFQLVKAMLLEGKSIVITLQYLCFCDTKAQLSPFDSIDITFLFDFSSHSLLSSLRSSTYKEANAPHHDFPPIASAQFFTFHSSLFTSFQKRRAHQKPRKTIDTPYRCLSEKRRRYYFLNSSPTSNLVVLSMRSGSWSSTPLSIRNDLRSSSSISPVGTFERMPTIVAIIG